MQPTWILAAIVIGLVVALLVTGVMRAGLKSVSKQYSADFYGKEQGLELKKTKDVFLYRTLDKIPKPKEQPRQNNAPRK